MSEALSQVEVRSGVEGVTEGLGSEFSLRP